jgi:hypothetical protein
LELAAINTFTVSGGEFTAAPFFGSGGGGVLVHPYLGWISAVTQEQPAGDGGGGEGAGGAGNGCDNNKPKCKKGGDGMSDEPGPDEIVVVPPDHSVDPMIVILSPPPANIVERTSEELGRSLLVLEPDSLSEPAVQIDLSPLAGFPTQGLRFRLEQEAREVALSGFEPAALDSLDDSLLTDLIQRGASPVRMGLSRIERFQLAADAIAGPLGLGQPAIEARPGNTPEPVPLGARRGRSQGVESEQAMGFRAEPGPVAAAVALAIVLGAHHSDADVRTQRRGEVGLDRR